MAVMKYSTDLTLYNSYFDANDKLSLKSILSIFQDVASIHAEEIGVGFSDMLARGFYWVLVRIKIDVIKMPFPNQKVKVLTYPLEKGRIDFDRELKITSMDGETLITGISKWCIIDTATRSLKRTDGVNYVGEYCAEKIYEEPFNKILLPESEFDFKLSHRVSFSDLDHNWHMNNTNYASLVASASESKEFSHFEINFLSECKLGDELNVYLAKSNGEYFKGEASGKTSFTAYLK